LIYLQQGGQGSQCFLLLHGLGCTGAVWHGVAAEIERRELGRWLAPDLPGHGESSTLEHYSPATLAQALLPILPQGERITILAHSMGVYVGLSLASQCERIQGLLGLGPKVSWTPDDLALARDLSDKTPRMFASQADAQARYRRVSGLGIDVAPDAEFIARGASRTADGWRLAADPQCILVAGTPFEPLLRAARCPVKLARGASDPIVSLLELKGFDVTAQNVEQRGHNVHAEDPRAVVALAARFG
jgi:pimeloyl-ACP methyl ester carboxylesterase